MIFRLAEWGLVARVLGNDERYGRFAEGHVRDPLRACGVVRDVEGEVRRIDVEVGRQQCAAVVLVARNGYGRLFVLENDRRIVGGLDDGGFGLGEDLAVGIGDFEPDRRLAVAAAVVAVDSEDQHDVLLGVFFEPDLLQPAGFGGILRVGDVGCRDEDTFERLRHVGRNADLDAFARQTHELEFGFGERQRRFGDRAGLREDDLLLFALAADEDARAARYAVVGFVRKEEVADAVARHLAHFAPCAFGHFGFPAPRGVDRDARRTGRGGEVESVLGDGQRLVPFEVLLTARTEQCGGQRDGQHAQQGIYFVFRFHVG